MNRDGVLVDVAVGALVTFALSFVPFSSVIGGAVTAGRRARGYRSGFVLGLAAGFVAMVPLLVFFVPALSIAGALGFGIAPSAPAYGLFLALVGVFFLVYTVGCSGLGGLVGVWLGGHTDWDLDPARWL